MSNGQATSNTFTANTTAGGPYNVVASAPGATPTVNFSRPTSPGRPTRHGDLGHRPDRHRRHGLHQPAGGHGHRPVRQPGLGRDGDLHSPTHWRLGHLHHLGHRGDQRQWRGHLEHLHGQHDGRRALQRRGLGHRRHRVNFAETNVTGAAHTVTATSGTGQSATVSTAFTNPLVATVTDQYGNPVSGVTVTFTAPGQRRLGHLHHLGHRGDQASDVATSTPTRPTPPPGPTTSWPRPPGHIGELLRTNRAPDRLERRLGDGTTSVTTSAFTQTSGNTYLITAYESSSGNGTPTTPTPAVSGGGTPTLIVTNNFGGARSPNCGANPCYEWAWWYNASTTNASATVVLTFNNTPQASVVDVVALSGNSTTTPIVTTSTTTASSTSSTTITGDTANAPASGDITLQLLASDNEIGASAVTWSPASTNLYFHNAATNTGGASLQVNSASPGQQNESASASGFGSSQDWGTIALEIGHA